MTKKSNIHFLFVMLAAVLWGTAGLFVRTAQKTDLTPMDLVFWRAAITSAILAVVILFKDVKLFKIKLKDIWIFLCGGLFSIVLFNFSYYTTMSLTSLSVAAVLLYTAPFFAMVISLILFGEKLTWSKGLALVFVFIGCCFVSGLFSTAHRISTNALIFGLLTGFGYALYTIFSELLIKRGYKTLTITFYIFLTAAISGLFLVDVKSTVVYTFGNPTALATVFLMALFNTVLPYIFYTAGLIGVSPAVAPIIATLEPVVATIVGIAVFNEPLSLEEFLGIVLVLASVAMLNIKPIRVGANAKINLVLSITGRREDGYHLIDTVMQSVTLSDIVRVKKAKKKITVLCSNKELKGEVNTAYKAAKYFFEYTELKKGVFIYITKKIPESAGLGGGSADAAAVLLALDRLYKTNLTTKELEQIAVKIGADVPFFIRGGTMRAQGIGDILTEVSPLKSGYIVLVKAGTKPSTAHMYKMLDETQYSQPDVQKLITAIEKEDEDALCDSLGNSFDSVWQSDDIKDKLLELGAKGVCLSGSGPTYFAYFSGKKKAKEAVRLLKKENILCFLTKPCEISMFYV